MARILVPMMVFVLVIALWPAASAASCEASTIIGCIGECQPPTYCCSTNPADYEAVGIATNLSVIDTIGIGPAPLYSKRFHADDFYFRHEALRFADAEILPMVDQSPTSSYVAVWMDEGGFCVCYYNPLEQGWWGLSPAFQPEGEQGLAYGGIGLIHDYPAESSDGLVQGETTCSAGTARTPATRPATISTASTRTPHLKSSSA